VDCHATGAQTDIQNNESKTAFDLAKDALQLYFSMLVSWHSAANIFQQF